jgi:hypothetical protein
MKRPLSAGLAILVAWTVIDTLLHRLVLAPIYEASASLWRPLDQLNVALIYGVTFVLIGVFVGVFRVLVRPKSFRAGVALGAFVGLALGVASGFGTFIHMPIPLSLAWGWFLGGWVKGLVAGGIVGAVIIEMRGEPPDKSELAGRVAVVTGALGTRDLERSPTRDIPHS